MTMKMRLKIMNRSCLKNVPLYNDGYMYGATPKQHFKLNSSQC